MDSPVSLGHSVFQGWQRNYTLAPPGGFRVTGPAPPPPFRPWMPLGGFLHFSDSSNDSNSSDTGQTTCW